MLLLARLGFGIVLCGILLYFVDWTETVEILLTAALVPAVLSLVLLAANVFISSLKWRILLLGHHLDISWWDLTRLYWISSFFGNYLPTNFGGDVLRVIMLNKLGQNAAVAASIIVERITGFVVLIAWSATALVIRPEYFSIGNLLIFLWLAVGAAVFAIGCLLLFGERTARLLHRLGESLSNKKVRNIIGKIQNVINQVTTYSENRRAVVVSLILSVLFYVFIALSNFLILTAVYANLSILEVALIIPIIPLISLLPVTFNGLGLAEGAYVLFFTQAGLPPSQALAGAVIRRLNQLLISFVGCGFWLSHRTIEMTRQNK